MDRQALLTFLENPRRRQAAGDEARRFRSVGELLARAREERHFRRISIPATRPVFHVDLAGLPAGIEIGPRELTVHFDDPQDLITKLFAVSQALANDYETFEAAWRSANP